MADTTLRPVQNAFETTLIQDLNTTDLLFYCADVPDATIPSGKKVAIVISADTPNQEIVLVESFDTSDNTMTIATGGRSQNLGNGLAGTANQHVVGAKVIISDDYATLDDYGDSIDSKVNIEGDTMTGALGFSGTTQAGIKPIRLTTAQRTALVLGASDSAVVFDTDTGTYWGWDGSSWNEFSEGTAVPNASTSVPGIVLLSTQALNDSGEAASGGMPIVAPPNLNADTIQRGMWVYAASSTGNDTYVITLTPTATAYTNGMRVFFKSDVANTGACTINIDGLGAINIQKNVNGTMTALEDNDIPANYIAEVVYNSTGPIFELLNPAQGMSRANASTLTGGASSNADSLHTHSFRELGLNKAGTAFSYQIPIFTDNAGWTVSGAGSAYYGSIANIDGSGSLAYAYLNRVGVPGTSGTTSNGMLMSWDTAQTITLEWYSLRSAAPGTNDNQGWGLFASGDTIDDNLFDYTNSSDACALFVEADTGVLRAKTANTANVETTTINGVTLTSGNLYKIVFTAGSVEYYVNGTLVATHTTYVPTGSSNVGLIHCAAANKYIFCSLPTITVTF